jgi:hypothetical protein
MQITNKSDDGQSGSRRVLHGLALIVPVVACLFCPVCLPAGLALLSAFGLGVMVGEGVHHLLVAASLTLVFTSAVVSARRHRRLGPVAATVAGSVLVVVGCIVFEVPPLEYGGVGLVATAAIWNWRLRRPAPTRLFRIHRRTPSAPHARSATASSAGSGVAGARK